MNPEIKTLLTIGLVFLVLFYSSGITMVSLHENAHKEIFRSYDIDSEIKINYFLISGETSADYSEVQEKCDDFCQLAHNQNEIVGYHLSGLVSIIVFLFCIYFMIKLMGANYGREETNSNTI